MQTIGWFQGNTWNCLGSNPLGCLPFAVVKKTASWPGMSDTDVWRHVSPGEGWSPVPISAKWVLATCQKSPQLLHAWLRCFAMQIFINSVSSPLVHWG
jgi:hypothetical protein